MASSLYLVPLMLASFPDVRWAVDSPAPRHSAVREGEVPAMHQPTAAAIDRGAGAVLWSCPIDLGERIVDSIANCHW